MRKIVTEARRNIRISCVQKVTVRMRRGQLRSDEMSDTNRPERAVPGAAAGKLSHVTGGGARHEQ